MKIKYNYAGAKDFTKRNIFLLNLSNLQRRAFFIIRKSSLNIAKRIRKSSTGENNLKTIYFD